VVQVAQVFIVDAELRRQLEAEVRNAIRVKSELSEIQTREGIRVAQTVSERRLQQEALEAERQRVAIDREKLRLRKGLDRASVEEDTPVRLLTIDKETEVLRKELEKAELEVRVRELAARAQAAPERVRQELRQEILPLEQRPALAEALSRVFQGAQLSLYGPDAGLVGALAPVLDLLTRALKGAGGDQGA
jgi:hypothetical protein